MSDHDSYSDFVELIFLNRGARSFQSRFRPAFARRWTFATPRGQTLHILSSFNAD
jgi:hypothetical protein